MITGGRENIKPKSGVSNIFGSALEKVKTTSEKLEDTNISEAETKVEPEEEQSPSTEVTAEPEVVCEEKVQEPEQVQEEVKQEPAPVVTENTEPTAQPPVVEETELVQEPVEVQKVQEEVVGVIEAQQPSATDSHAFTRLTASSETANLSTNDSFAEMVEGIISRQCQLSGVKNLDLASFGIRTKTLQFRNLSVLEFGIHRFLGVPFTQIEEDKIIHNLALHVAQSEKNRVVIAAVLPIEAENNIRMYCLQFTDTIAQRFADMFEYSVYINKHESDLSKLVMVIEK